MNETTCAFEGCGRDGKTRLGRDSNGPKYCSGHYNQWYRGEEIRPLKPMRKLLPDPEGLRICSKCEEAKTIDQFYRRSSGSLQRHCKPCMIAANTITNRARLAREVSWLATYGPVGQEINSGE